MRKVRITVMKIACHSELSAQYENPLPHPCVMQVGQVFLSEEAQMPEGFCESAWGSLFPFVMTLACGGTSIYGEWMKNPSSAMISCNDGFRPVSFYLETI